MEFSKEQIEKAKNCKTLEELKELSIKEGLSLTEKELKDVFSLTRSGELNEDDLDKVAGGTKYSSGVWGPNGFQKYVIVTAFNNVGDECYKHGLDNRCIDDHSPRYHVIYCKDCVNRFFCGATGYCGKRWEGNDPLKK